MTCIIHFPNVQTAKVTIQQCFMLAQLLAQIKEITAYDHNK